MKPALQLQLVGIGSGNPEHLSLAAIRALNEADLILLPDKGENKAGLLELRREICAQHLSPHIKRVEFELPVRASTGDYLQAVADWHDAIARCWQDNIDAHLPANGCKAALMVWGDPSLYDSTLRIAARLITAGGRAISVEVIPGITSVQVLCAAHAIPLNEVGAAVHLTTGRLLRAHGWPRDADTVVVMLDAGGAFEVLLDSDDTFEIWWGACLGLPSQTLRAGPLQEVAADILATRARLRAELGWVMDVYLLRRRRQSQD